MGLEKPTDLQLRSGLEGTQANPASMDPFKTYELVMAANECRYFRVKVPAKWFWKVSLTVANREDARRGKLAAAIDPTNPNWAPLQGAGFSKNFDLGREGLEALLGVGNPGPDQIAVLHLCQDGAPLHITIQCQISATKALLGPGDIRTPVPGDN
jgi:hypothetical protein